MLNHRLLLGTVGLKRRANLWALTNRYFVAPSTYVALDLRLGKRAVYSVQQVWGKVRNLESKYFSTRRRVPKKERSPYEVLNVSKTATDKEIKLAYFREAKKWHPDMNANDPSAKEKFQEIGAAYEILSNPLKRKKYEEGGSGYGNASSSQSQSYSQSYSQAKSQANPNTKYSDPAGEPQEDIFSSVKHDVDVMKEAFKNFAEDVKDEFAHAADSISKGNWQEAWKVVKNNSGVIFGILLPLVLFVRYPPAVMAAARASVWAAQLIFLFLLRTGNFALAGRWLWGKLVELARRKKSRRK